MRVTIKQVAAEAGVSRGAVDKVIHNRPGISEEVRKRVQDVIKKLGYKPNKAARALLVSRKQTTFAVIIPKLNNPFFDKFKLGIDAATQNLNINDYGVKLEFYYCNDFDTDKLTSILTYLKSKKIQGLIVRGTQNLDLDNSLSDFSANKIPIITYDSDIPSIDRLCFIGEDSIKSGRIAASLLSKSIGLSGDVAIFLGSKKVRTHQLRAQGFIDYLTEKTPDINVIDIFETFEQSIITQDLTKNIIAKYPNLKGIFNVASGSEDIASIIHETNAKVKMVTYDSSPAIKKYIKNGTIDYTITLSPLRQGYLALQTLFNYVFFNEAPTKEIINVQLSIGIDENIDLYATENNMTIL